MVIKIYPSEGLKTSTEEVTEFGEELEALALSMKKIMDTAGGVGLAANQAGYNKSMFVAKIDDGVFINPKIVDSSGTVSSTERCLSFPGISVKVERAEIVVLEYYDAFGKKYSKAFTGQDAIIIQHEYDHLQGIGLIDHASPTKQKLIMRKMSKWKRKLSRKN